MISGHEDKDTLLGKISKEYDRKLAILNKKYPDGGDEYEKACDELADWSAEEEGKIMKNKSESIGPKWVSKLTPSDKTTYDELTGRIHSEKARNSPSSRSAIAAAESDLDKLRTKYSESESLADQICEMFVGEGKFDGIEVDDKVMVKYGEYKGKTGTVIEKSPSGQYSTVRVAGTEVNYDNSDLEVKRRPSM